MLRRQREGGPSGLVRNELRHLDPRLHPTARSAPWPHAVAALAAALAALVSLGAGTGDAFAAPKSATPPHLAARYHDAYSDHPVVHEVTSGGVLGLLARERALSDDVPSDRALAIIDAVGADTAKRLFVGDGVARALRARHGVGPSGALLGKAMDVGVLTGREALVLGWARALEAADDRRLLTRKGTTILTAGARDLLTMAVAKAPQSQAARLALALVGASLAPRSGKAACAAWVDVQKAARDGGAESVRLAAAEAAVVAVVPLARACKASVRKPFAVAISLPPPAPERAPSPARVGRPGRPSAPTGQGGAKRFGVAWTVLSPFFKGYLDDALVGRLARGERLDELSLVNHLKRDPTGDLCVAALNASILMRRLAYDDVFAIAWAALLRNHGLVGADEARAQALPLSALTGPEAVMWAYAKAIAGQGDATPSDSSATPAGTAAPSAPTAYDASPRQLFAYGRKRTPGNALLGPVVALAHEVDVARSAGPCNARERADNTAFVIERGALPPAAKKALSEAMRSVVASCGQAPAPAPTGQR